MASSLVLLLACVIFMTCVIPVHMLGHIRFIGAMPFRGSIPRWLPHGYLLLKYHQQQQTRDGQELFATSVRGHTSCLVKRRVARSMQAHRGNLPKFNRRSVDHRLHLLYRQQNDRPWSGVDGAARAYRSSRPKAVDKLHIIIPEAMRLCVRRAGATTCGDRASRPGHLHVLMPPSLA